MKGKYQLKSKTNYVLRDKPKAKENKRGKNKGMDNLNCKHKQKES